jgi:hypothetical protein
MKLYIIQLGLNVSKFQHGTHTKSNWKCIVKYVDCEIQKQMCNYRLSVKHVQSSNIC